jgi:hypothetical protein
MNHWMPNNALMLVHVEQRATQAYAAFPHKATLR